MSLARGFLAALEGRPGRTLLEGDGGRHAAGALALRARALAGALRRAGVRPGDRVVACLPKDDRLVVGHVAALAAGAVVVPLNPAHPDAALADQVRRVEPALGLVGPELAARGPRLAPSVPWWWSGAPDEAPAGAEPAPADGEPLDPVPRSPGDAALLVFTSGTTGRPKGVPLSHGNLASNLEALRRVWEWGPGDRLLHVLPVFHLHGLGVALYGTLLAGGSLVLHERFDAARVLREAGPRGATLLMAVPTMLHRLVEAAGPAPDRRLAGLRAVISGSAPLAPALFERFRQRFGLAPVERYGMSETMMNASNPTAGPCVPGSVGRPLPGVSLRLADPASGADAGRGPGEVQVRGPNVFRGYWRDAAASAAAFCPSNDGGPPWFRTGDLGRLDEAGRLFLVGRSKEIIVTGGYNVSPLAVEQALEAESEPRLAELAVAGVPDPDLGERVVAFVVPREPGDGAALAEALAVLQRRAEARLPRYARPREYRAVEALPRTALGKVERARLAGRQAAGESR